MAGNGHHSNNSILNMLWNSSDETFNDAMQSQSESAQQQEPKMQIRITGPIESQQSNQQKLEEKEEEKTKSEEKSEAVQEPPTLTESAAFSTLRMFHDDGLAGDSEDIFAGINVDSNININTNNNPNNNNNDSNINSIPSMHDQTFQELAMSGSLPAVNEDSVFNANIHEKPSQLNVDGAIIGNGINGGGINGGINGINGINDINAINGMHGVKGIATYSNIIDGDIGNGLFNPQSNILQTGNMPQPIRGGGRNHSNDNNKNVIAKNDEWFENNFGGDDGIGINDGEEAEYYQETQPRKANDVKDMEDYKEITHLDLEQFESMLSNTEKLIDDMLDICNYNGYGLNEDNNKEYDNSALNNNIAMYRNYVNEQLFQYNFNLSSNAIVDLMGVPHTMSFKPNNLTFKPKDCCISSQGYILFKNKRLTPHYYFNIIDYRQRRRIDITIAKIIRDYLRRGHFEMNEFFYPSSESLKGVTPILIPHFEEQCKIFYKLPYKIRRRTESIQFDSSHDDNYCVIVFPNHKSHIKPGIWSRSVTYFDNVIRGTMFQFIENCTSISNGNGWGIILLNPNQRYIESEQFGTKEKYDDDLEIIKNTETITIPRNESSYAHTIEMYKNFIIPQIINIWKCKLLLISHCDGGNDIIHLLETQQNIHKHIIGIAMLDFYNWSLSQFTKKTKQIIEQKAAIYMSLYGSNESAYGLEPSHNKSPVTIFRTANKEKRYSPAYNTESVIRFFKSKIELHKQK